MKFFFDRNLPKQLAKAIGELCAGEDIEVVFLDERFPKDCPDDVWIRELGRETGWAIVTQDRLFKGNVERAALRETGILTFVLSNQWAHQKLWDKAWSLVRWWPTIMQVSNMIKGGAFLVPFKFSGHGKLEQIKL